MQDITGFFVPSVAQNSIPLLKNKKPPLRVVNLPLIVVKETFPATWGRYSLTVLPKGGMIARKQARNAVTPTF